MIAALVSLSLCWHWPEPDPWDEDVRYRVADADDPITEMEAVWREERC